MCSPASSKLSLICTFVRCRSPFPFSNSISSASSVESLVEILFAESVAEGDSDEERDLDDSFKQVCGKVCCPCDVSDAGSSNVSCRPYRRERKRDWIRKVREIQHRPFGFFLPQIFLMDGVTVGRCCVLVVV